MYTSISSFIYMYTLSYSGQYIVHISKVYKEFVLLKRERNCQKNLLDMNFDSNYQIAISYNLHVADLYAKK